MRNRHLRAGGICGHGNLCARDARRDRERHHPQNPVATDGPAAGYESILMDVVIDAGATVARHTHPGMESSYVMEGDIELPVQGQPTRTVKAGEGFQIPPNTPHAGGKASNAKTRVMITYIVEKGKPLASPA